MATGLAGQAICADASEIGLLKDEIKQLTSRLEKLELEQSANSEQLQQTVDSISWVQDLEIGGDFRFRYDQIDQDGKNERNRNRLRVRLNIKAKINDDVDFYGRLASGAGEPASTNQTMDGSWTGKGIWIDRAYLNWKLNDNINVLAGKMANPFYAPGKSQLLWDGDLNPEGGAVQYNGNLGGMKVFANAAAMWVEENSSEADQGMFGIQAGFITDISLGKLTAGAGYFDYGNTSDTATFYDSSKSFGNTTLASGEYAYDYNLLEGFAEMSFNTETPVSIFADYVNNTASDVEQDTAWLIGGQLGKAKSKGSWQLGYNYRDVESDAVIGAFSDSDFIGGGTNGKGHMFQGKYAIADNMAIGATYFANNKGDNDDDFNRLLLDVEMKF